MSWQTVDRILKQRKLNLRQLSNDSGVNYQTLRNYRYLKSEPSFKNMVKVADALGISLEDLRGDRHVRHSSSNSGNG